MLIEEMIAKAAKAYKDATIAEEMARYVMPFVDDLAEGVEIGTGALIKRMRPEHTEKEYAALVSLLALVRQVQPRIWRYTGKKNRFGKQALVWHAYKPPSEAEKQEIVRRDMEAAQRQGQ